MVWGQNGDALGTVTHLSPACPPGTAGATSRRWGWSCWTPSPGFAFQAAVAFEDVAIYFSPEEWVELAAWQRELYQEVMMDNYDLVACLGKEEPCQGLGWPKTCMGSALGTPAALLPASVPLLGLVPAALDGTVGTPGMSPGPLVAVTLPGCALGGAEGSLSHTGSVDTSSKLVPKMEPEEEPCGGASPGEGDRETPDTAGIGEWCGVQPPGCLGTAGWWLGQVPCVVGTAPSCAMGPVAPARGGGVAAQGPHSAAPEGRGEAGAAHVVALSGCGDTGTLP